MKQFLLLFSALLFITSSVAGQSFDEAMELYEDEQFGQAAEIFEQLDDDRSILFAGKSHLASGNYGKARIYLNQVLGSSAEVVHQEARYTLAILHFRIKNYDSSLQHLYDLIQSDNRTGIRINAQRLYNQILSYLSTGERFELLRRLESGSIRFDLVYNSRSYVDRETFGLMTTKLLSMESDPARRNDFRERLSADSRDSGGSARQTGRYPEAPQGTVYHVGVILPAFAEDDPDFTIPRNLYYGMVLAADEFNSRNADKKVQLIFRNSAENPDTTARAFTDLVWAEYADAVIGPLFSEPAIRMARLAEDFNVPMLAPLANADELNLDYNYTFQLNPTQELHGKRMARFAVQELRLNSLAVIIEESSHGRTAALSFQREAERLGANITYFIEEDFASRGYDMTETAEVFTSSSALRDSLGYKTTQGIYAPFTGQAAGTMSNLLLNALEAMRSDPVIFGSEEWADVNVTSFQQRFFEIYYTEAFGAAPSEEDAGFFNEDFETRFGIASDNFAKAGYDAANYLMKSLETAGNPAYLKDVLRTGEPYNGMTFRVNFDGKRVNQNLFIRPHSDRARQRMQ